MLAVPTLTFLFVKVPQSHPFTPLYFILLTYLFLLRFSRNVISVLIPLSNHTQVPGKRLGHGFIIIRYKTDKV